jgi:photosystem II stability/assembly factor-like uncharacterized protein
VLDSRQLPVNVIATSRHHGQHLLACGQGFYSSDDGGASWSPAELPPPEDHLSAIAELDDDPQVVFTASRARVLYRSNDRGRTFDRIGEVPLPDDARSDQLQWTTLATLPGTTGASPILLLGSSLGAHVSTDEGRSWKPLTAGRIGTDYKVSDFLFADDDSELLMATNEGLFSRAIATVG